MSQINDYAAPDISGGSQDGDGVINTSWFYVQAVCKEEKRC